MYEGIVQDLIDEFGRLPGIGPKSAQRIASLSFRTRTTSPPRYRSYSRRCEKKFGFVRRAG